jgi:hypothetical protein
MCESKKTAMVLVYRVALAFVQSNFPVVYLYALASEVFKNTSAY